MTPASAFRLLAWSLGVAAVSRGAESELARLERDYLAQRDAVVRPLLTGFAEKLRSLHAKLSQRRDPGAAAVKAELDRTLARLALPPEAAEPESPGTRPPGPAPVAGRGSPAPIELRGPKAILAGDATYDERIVAGVQFKGKGAAAVWHFPPLNAGRYRLKLEWGCAPGFGAIVQLRFGDQPPRTLAVQATGDSGLPSSFNLGEVELPNGITSLKVEMTDVPPRIKGTGGFNLHLVAIASAEPPGP